jgi:hypothetical protein
MLSRSGFVQGALGVDDPRLAAERAKIDVAEVDPGIRE